VPVLLISTGAGRDDTIVRNGPLAAAWVRLVDLVISFTEASAACSMQNCRSGSGSADENSSPAR